jgi:hypothetical protein
MKSHQVALELVPGDDISGEWQPQGACGHVVRVALDGMHRANVLVNGQNVLLNKGDLAAVL